MSQEGQVTNVVSFDQEDILPKSMPMFKGIQDSYYRIYIPDISNILMYRQHYVENVGFARCLQDKGEQCPICRDLNEPITRFKLNILVYSTTTADGTLPSDLNFVALEHKVWRIGIKQFGMLKAKHKKNIKNGGLPSVDLILKCTNGAYQHFDIEDDLTCAVKEDSRLAAMAKKIIEKSFVDFSTNKDRDLKFLSPLQLKNFMEKATGVSQPDPEHNENKAEGAEAQIDANLENDDESSASVADLI